MAAAQQAIAPEDPVNSSWIATARSRPGREIAWISCMTRRSNVAREWNSASTSSSPKSVDETSASTVMNDTRLGFARSAPWGLNCPIPWRLWVSATICLLRLGPGSRRESSPCFRVGGETCQGRRTGGGSCCRYVTSSPARGGADCASALPRGVRPRTPAGRFSPRPLMGSPSGQVAGTPRRPSPRRRSCGRGTRCSRRPRPARPGSAAPRCRP